MKNCSSNNRDLFSHSSGVWKSIKVPIGLVSPEAFLLGLHMATSLLCLTWAFLYVFELLGAFLSSYKDNGSIALEPHPYDI